MHAISPFGLPRISFNTNPSLLDRFIREGSDRTNSSVLGCLDKKNIFDKKRLRNKARLVKMNNMEQSVMSKFRISARNLGPMHFLEGHLGHRSRNLIFDGNGAAKSSLCRAFQFIDQYTQKQDVLIDFKKIIFNETVGDDVEFSISRGASNIAKLILQKRDENPNPCVSKATFHVFSEKFVNEEVSEIRYEVGGNKVEEKIIVVGKENIKLNEIEQSCEKLYGEIESKTDKLELLNKGNIYRKIKSSEAEMEKLRNELRLDYVRDLVADTFYDLLQYFFESKYVFNKEKFIILRKDPARKISPGEKAIIAFCYFLACIRRKIAATSYHERLFLIFDDPVASLSYQYIYDIVRALDTLRISKCGRVQINIPMRGRMQTNAVDAVDDNFYEPDWLILTKNVYLYNILTSSNIILHDSRFVLFSAESTHEPSLSKYELRLLENHEKIRICSGIPVPSSETSRGEFSS